MNEQQVARPTDSLSGCSCGLNPTACRESACGEKEPKTIWIDCNDRLPAWNKLVVAYMKGTKEHTNARWVRSGCAFMVRHNSREHVVGTDQWAVFQYNRALAELDADELTVTHWMPLERPS